jgi:hypothetical protein
MANLQNVQTRVARQDRPTDRRAGVLPERRNTEAPQRQFQADMRDARRGDVGGAEELMRTLGFAKQGAADFQQYAEENFREEEAANAAEGSLDAAAGKVDETQMRRSRAYRASVSRGRAQERWYKHMQATEQGMRALIEQQTEADPLKRQKEVEDYIEGRFREFAIDPETGQPVDFGDPAAMRWVAEQMGGSRAQLRARGVELSEERLNETAISTAANVVVERLRAGQDLDFEEIFRNLPPSVDRRKAREAGISALRGYITELEASENEEDWTKALQLADALYGSRRGGTAEAPAPGSIQSVDPDTGQPVDGPIFSDPYGAQTSEQPNLSAWNGGAASNDVPEPEAAGPKAPRPAAPQARSGGFNMASYIRATRGAESGGNDNARNPRSSASGRFQFTNRTFRGVYRQVYGRSLPGGRDDPIPANIKHDPAVQDRLMERFTQDNINQLKAAGVEINDATVYAAHHFGANGMLQMRRNPNGALPADVVAANPHLKGKTNGQALQWAANHIGRRGGNVGSETGQERPKDESIIPQRPDFTYDPKPETALDRANAEPGEITIEADGLFSLTPQQRAEWAEFRSALRSRIEAKVERATDERQTEAAGRFLDRVMGMGTYPTPTEVQEARKRGEITAQAAAQVMNIMQGDVDRQRTAEDRRIAQEDRRMAREDRARERQAAAMAEAYLGNVYGGVTSVEQARAQLLGQLAGIKDPELRRSVHAQVVQGLNMVAATREASPAYMNAQERLAELEHTMMNRLSRNIVGHPGGREAIEQDIRQLFARMKTRLGRAVSGNGDIDGLARQITQEINQRVMNAYGRYFKR